jgi:hypothetical protein
VPVAYQVSTCLGDASVQVEKNACVARPRR